MYKIPAKTLFVGKNLIYVPQCHSTNSLANELSQTRVLEEGTIVITDNQFAGRGQTGNTWEAAPGENITMSLILHPVFLQPRDQFLINAAISLGVTDYLSAHTELSTKIWIKWPNDLYAADHKLGGILIENHIQAAKINFSVVGIGLNINQENFRPPKARSLRSLTNRIFELGDELELLAHALEFRYLELKENKRQKLVGDYLAILYRKDEAHRYKSEDGEWTGVIKGIDETGRLRILKDNKEKVFAVKEVVFI